MGIITNNKVRRGTSIGDKCCRFEVRGMYLNAAPADALRGCSEQRKVLVLTITVLRCTGCVWA